MSIDQLTSILHASLVSRSCSLAYRGGVTTGIVAPTHRRFYAGLSTSFFTGAPHKLEEGAVIQDVNALHVTVRHFGSIPSISTQIAVLRKLLLEPGEGEAGEWFEEVREVSNVSLRLFWLKS